MKSWWGKDTDQNISARSLTLLIFAVRWALCGRPQPVHESVMPPTAVTFSVKCFNPLQELSYRKQIACQLHTQFVEGISVTLKFTLRVTQDHWKRNHWTGYTRLTIRRVIGLRILSWPWNVGQRSLKVIESGTIWKFGYGFLIFPTLTLTLGLGLG